MQTHDAMLSCIYEFFATGIIRPLAADEYAGQKLYTLALFIKKQRLP
jgi:hypothetical protein